MPKYEGRVFWIVVAAAAFHAAYASATLSLLVVLYLFALLQLARADGWRQAFYSGLAVGLLVAAARLAFFWRIFSGGAGALWLVYAFWIALFVALARLCMVRFAPNRGWLLIPLVWVGLEYFRSELYYLRFSWLSAGYALTGACWQGALKPIGVYGAGFLLMSLATGVAFLWRTSRAYACALLIVGAGGFGGAGHLCGQWPPPRSLANVRVAGVQMEFPSGNEVLVRLNDLLRSRPNVELIVLSEYTFDGPVPGAVKDWCRKNRRYLVVGGKDPIADGDFYNTAYVIGPDGHVAFRQVKVVPIQFFKDGRPAREQKLWNSPWGKIGICVCYDLSYTRVTDRLVKLGAEALVVPPMDVADWGQSQHELHGRIAPTRAAEYGLPIFRLASSGISQVVDSAGRVTATAPFPGDGAALAETLELRGAGSRPLDRWLAPLAVGVTSLLAFWFLVQEISHAFRNCLLRPSTATLTNP
jgi:apolipoprotein N-acyltransferase